MIDNLRNITIFKVILQHTYPMNKISELHVPSRRIFNTFQLPHVDYLLIGFKVQPKMGKERQ